VTHDGPQMWVTVVFMRGPNGLVGDPPNQTTYEGLYDMIFPVVGDNHYSDTWGACRGTNCSRTHEGTDIMADKMIPVVAVAAGTVYWQHAEQGGNCCAMGLAHDDGWVSYYIHLNNDTPGTDDGQGWGFADDITVGTHVEAGQLIGWVGDSGNAESAGSHLHFELHTPDGAAISSYEHLIVARGAAEGRDVVTYVDGGSQFHRPNVLAGVPDRFYFGIPRDIPLMGDWDCDGVNTPAMYRPSNGFVYLTNANEQAFAESEFFYGIPGDIPLAGDWDGNGCDSFAIYRPGEGRVYIRNQLGTGFADYSFAFGVPGDQPFAGDFNGDGIDTVGMYRLWNGLVYYRNVNSPGPAHHQFFFGVPGDRIVAGDWDGDGDDTVAVYRPSSQYLLVNMENNAGPTTYTLWVGRFENVVVSSGS